MPYSVGQWSRLGANVPSGPSDVTGTMAAAAPAAIMAGVGEHVVPGLTTERQRMYVSGLYVRGTTPPVEVGELVKIFVSSYRRRRF